MSNYYRRRNLPPAMPEMNRRKAQSDRRGLRPERAPKYEYKKQQSRDKPELPLRFEKPKTYENIFERYDIGNKNLPTQKHESEIVEQIESNKVSVLSGATGSGKTTQLPQMALKAGYDRIVVLQPRRINADGSGDRVETEIREKMGDDYPTGLVGVAHSERMTVQPESKVQFMTADTFSNMLPKMREGWSEQKVLIMADETHENGVPTEFACALALQSVEEYNDWRMVYASATPDESLKDNVALAGVNGGDIPEIHIEGRPQNIEYSEDPENDIVGTYNSLASVSKKTMMFVEGIPAAEHARSDLLRSMSEKDAARTKVFLLSSQTSTRDKKSIMDMQLKDGQRAVIISTSAGQSGITISGLETVILSGITRSPEIDDERADGLPVRLCTQAELTQQGGRTGRDVPGRVILSSPIREHKSSENIDDVHKFTPFEDRETDMPPEVYHTNISRNALKVAAMGTDFKKINSYMKNPLSQRSVAEANDVLFNLDAIDENDKITNIGKRMDSYSFRPEISRAMVEFEANTERSVQVQALAIASAIENGGLADYYRPGKHKELLRPDTKDDYMAQLDLMVASRPHYHGRYVDETDLRGAGINFVAAYRAHRQFDKMARVMGLGDARDIEIEHTTADQEQEIKNKFLTGMPELIFEHTSTKRGIPYYENVAGFQEPLERTISKRSTVAKMGGQAVKYLVGFPRWYEDKNGNKQDVIEMGYPVNKEQVQMTLGHLALRERNPEVRGDSLVNVAPRKLGNFDIGGKETERMVAKTEHEKELLAQAALNLDTPAVRQLRDIYVSDGEIFEALVEKAEGASSAYELDSKMWDMVGEKQSEWMIQYTHDETR